MAFCFVDFHESANTSSSFPFLVPGFHQLFNAKERAIVVSKGLLPETFRLEMSFQSAKGPLAMMRTGSTSMIPRWITEAGKSARFYF
jgi:hypothetical protein